MPLLAIETSCDDTCAAVVDGPWILSNVISSQAELHAAFGGVVPEVASRHHVELINPVVDEALNRAGVGLADVDGVAVTTRPGLIGALLIGVSSAKAYASAHRKPLIAVDHLLGHLAAAFLEPEPVEPPFLGLIASGGHTLLARVERPDSYELIGSTLDDAAGEAFDKGARLLGLGYPGGPAISRCAADGDAGAFDFPVAMSRDGSLDFSFSGLKTALVYAVRDLGESGVENARADLAASFEAAIVGQLIAKLRTAIRSERPPLVVLGGGVAANRRLRGEAAALCESEGVVLKLLAPELCTDNAAMIGSAAQHLPATAFPDYLGFDAAPR